MNCIPKLAPSRFFSVLLVSPSSMPQLGAILPSSQAGPPATQPATSQHAARIVSHLAAGSLPQVRVVSTQSGLGSSVGSQQATLVHQTPHQIRVPVSVAAKGISQVTTNNCICFSSYVEFKINLVLIVFIFRRWFLCLSGIRLLVPQSRCRPP